MSPIDTISETTRIELKQADELEAAGYRDEADLIRMKIYLSNEITAIGEIGGVSSLGFQAAKVMSKNITNVVDARRNMVSLVNSQRAEHILYGDKSGGGHKFGLTRIFNHKSKFPIHWTEKRILDEVSNIATDPNLDWVQQTGTKGSFYTKKGIPARFKVDGIVDGVKIRVIIEPAGEGVITAFPIK